jgi:hypothetical protein
MSACTTSVTPFVSPENRSVAAVRNPTNWPLSFTAG